MPRLLYKDGLLLVLSITEERACDKAHYSRAIAFYILEPLPALL